MEKKPVIRTDRVKVQNGEEQLMTMIVILVIVLVMIAYASGFIDSDSHKSRK